MIDLVRLYSKRLLQPYVGVVQVADLGWARALSLDGVNWAIRYSRDENKQTRHGRFSHDPRVNLSMIVTTDGNSPKTRVIRPNLDPEQVRLDSQRVFDVICDTQVPFEAADCYEYWLLDGSDESPLALLHSCLKAEEMRLPVPPPEWFTISAVELAIPDPDPEPQEPSTYQPPVNHRLQQLVEMRAGNSPRAAWFDRRESSTVYFPPCLIRDEWDDPEYQRLCTAYLERLAPRLLMIDGLPGMVRQRLEQAACEYVFDVDEFYPLYPDVINNSILNVARVEARLRRSNET
jgi:hypothetical protein